MATAAPPLEALRIATPAPTATRRGPARLLGTGLVWAFVIFNVGVLIWLVLASLKTTREIFEAPFGLPGEVKLDNYARAWDNGNFSVATRNTVLLVALASLTIVAISAPAAYVLSRVRSRWSSGLTLFFALGIGIPPQVVIVPIFVTIERMNLVDTLQGLYLIYVVFSLPFTVFLLTGFFRSLPSELEEAASLDGASPLRTFVLIMLPLARSGLITAFILNAIFLWSETFIAVILIQSDTNQTLSLALLGLMQTLQYQGANWGALFAGVCVIVLPMLALYVWLGRRIIEGLTLGAGR